MQLEGHRVQACDVDAVCRGRVRYAPLKSLWFLGMLSAALVGGALTFYSRQPGRSGTTTLRVSMRYRVSTRYNWYAQPVAELFVSNFEDTALRFYARRAEAQAARSL